jgi:hypothetical protein
MGKRLYCWRYCSNSEDGEKAILLEGTVVTVRMGKRLYSWRYCSNGQDIVLKGYIARGSVVRAMMLRGLYHHCCNGSQDVNVFTCLMVQYSV